MAAMVAVRVLTPAGVFLETEADSVVLPGLQGEFQVLPGHAPVFAMLDVGVLEVSGQDPAGLFGGVAEILPNSVLVLAANAEQGTLIDRQRADQARQRALERITARDSVLDIDFRRAELALARALLRLRLLDEAIGRHERTES